MKPSSALQSTQPLDVNPDTEALLAAELNKLSMQERDEMLQDIHGVSDVLAENPDRVERCFAMLRDALSVFPAHRKMAYSRARTIDPAKVDQNEFLLMFLRAYSFDIGATATAVVTFFETKMELFGPEKLTKDIGYEDLDEDDIRCLESGYIQVLPVRDRAGRAIIWFMPTIVQYRTLLNRQRAVYMVFMHALKDAETQKRGLVGIIYNLGNTRSNDRPAALKIARMVGLALPTNFKGVHYCYDNPIVKAMVFIAMLVWERSTRIRCRLHCGSNMECIFNLMTFGIPSEILPMTCSGEFRLEPHLEYCKRLQRASEIQDQQKRFVIPSAADVLLGRGKPLQKHVGNLRYHHLIECQYEQYEAAQKLEKTNISKLIVQEIRKSGGHFLRLDDFGWVEIDDDEARNKVSHTFRNHRIAAKVQGAKVGQVATLDSDTFEKIEESGVDDSKEEHQKGHAHDSHQSITPGEDDVLLGRGKPLQKHVGNLKYHQIIERYHDQYDSAHKLEKTNLSKEIVQLVKDKGGRFLKQQGTGWVEVDDDTARYKVSHTFRNHRIAARAQEQKKVDEVPPRAEHDSSDASSSGEVRHLEFRESDQRSEKRQRRVNTALSVASPELPHSM